MGSVLSSMFPTKKRQQQLLETLGCKKDVLQNLYDIGIGESSLLQLLEIYSEMDVDHSGSITIGEFFNYMELDHTPFCTKAFSLMDKNGSGEVDFVEFVMNLWNYCSLGKEHLVRYAFDLYDRDGSGEIEHEEVKMFLREVWGKGWAHNPRAIKVFGQLEALMSHNISGCLHLNQFEHYCECHPMLLFPAFELQSELQNRVLGERFWRNAAKRRVKLDPHDHATESFDHIVKLAHMVSRRELPVKIRKPSSVIRPKANKLNKATEASAHDANTSSNNPDKAKSTSSTKHPGGAIAVTNDLVTDHVIRRPIESSQKNNAKPNDKQLKPAKSWKKAYEKRSNGSKRSTELLGERESSMKVLFKKLKPGARSRQPDYNADGEQTQAGRKNLVLEDMESSRTLNIALTKKKPQPKK